MKPFSGGQLLSAKTSLFGKALTQYQCIKYALDKPGVLTVLPGAQSVEEIDHLLKFYDQSEEELDYGIIGNCAPPEASGKCVYCNHCKPCPVGLDIGMINKFYDLAKVGDDMARKHYMLLSKKAADCIGCGHCNSRCPFGVDQMRRMQEIREYTSLYRKENYEMQQNVWLDGIMGVIIGDALGCPVQFMERDELRKRGLVTGMEGHGTYDMPPGTWTDDSSMTLAAFDSIRELKMIDLDDIMTRFVDWYEDGEYTPFGEAFDIGNTCSNAIWSYENGTDVYTCGGTSEHSNGNGSLMRILPACLYAYEKKLPDEEAVKVIHEVSGLTHNHLRSKIACGLYYYCICAVLNGKGTLKERLQQGIDRGFAYYGNDISNKAELAWYLRLKDLAAFADLPDSEIRSSGYVVDALEAAIWSLLNTESFEECLLKTVNLGDDSDTIGAISGGVAGLFYGYGKIPEEWLQVIQRREWIEGMCQAEV